MTSPADSRARAAADGARLVALGRLLLASVGGGVLSGGLTAQVLVGVRGPYADGAFALGASVGMVAGPAVQVLHVLLLAVLRLRFPRPSARWGRLALLVLPVTSACALTAWLGDGVPTAASAVLVAGSTTAVLTWLVVPWCSAPLEAELR